MHRYCALLVVTVIAGLASALMTGAGAAGQPAPGQAAPGDAPSLFKQLWDTREGIYQPSHILSQLPQAVPGYVAGALAIILLASLFGFFEMGPVSFMVLLAAIGGIIYKFYWPPWH